MSNDTPDNTSLPPFETRDLRRNLAAFLKSEFLNDDTGEKKPIGSFKWGVYAFFDYDQEPIYIGQTREQISTRIRRHLTNQRTDAVAMSVLDPFEVYEIEIWPLPQFETTPKSQSDARAYLDALEYRIFQDAVERSSFNAVLNEKDPPVPTVEVLIPKSVRVKLVSDEVFRIRSHPDFRIARRALTISRLAQVISERQVQGGLRRVLLVQAKRLQWLAERRFLALGGETIVETEDGDGSDG